MTLTLVNYHESWTHHAQTRILQLHQSLETDYTFTFTSDDLYRATHQ